MATSSITTERPHQRQVTLQTSSCSVLDSSTRGRPARSKCQYSVVRRVRVTSNRVRLPQPAHRQRDLASGRDAATSSYLLLGCAGRTPRPGRRLQGMPRGDAVSSVATSTVPDMTRPASEAPARWESQRTFDELGRPLRDVTFVVVDLETTGGSAAGGSMITEIGAVKVRGGEVLGEFQTLVNPTQAIPAFIAVLTGITDSMVAGAPRIEQVLPQFLEFAQGCVLVAHNAPFDIGFLKHFAEQQGRPWPCFEVLDTAKLARRVVTRDDAPNCKLSSLAVLFGSGTTPNHRALSDARATVDVLHGLMERLGNLGVHTLEELQTFSSRVTSAQRRKRHLAEHLPHAPGVYLFRDERDRVLYVGTSKDLRTRVRSYFTASETRTRMGEMVTIAASVSGIVCATPLEAEVL